MSLSCVMDVIRFCLFVFCLFVFRMLYFAVDIPANSLAIG